MEFSVVICTYNGASTISECIESLLDQETESVYEIIVVNDGSTDKTASLLEKYKSDGLRVISHDTNRGLSAARNTGWQAANGEIVAYIDDDAVAPTDWLSAYEERYEECVDGVGGYPDSYYDELVGNYEVARGLYRYGPNAENIDGPGGMNMTFRRSFLKELGGFDEEFTHIGDDAELGRRLQKGDYNYIIDTSITVKHKFPRSVTEYCRKNFQRGKGAKQLSRKHEEQPRFSRFLLLAIVYPLMVPHAVYEGLQIHRFAEDESRIGFVILTYLLRVCNYWGIIYYWIHEGE